jgi:hypothetical protein
MTEKIQITKIGRYTTNQEGKPLVSTKGDPYTKVRINDQKGRVITVLDWNTLTGNWSEGMEIELTVEESRGPSGMTYFRGTIPNAKGKYAEAQNKMAEEIHWIFLKLGGGDSSEANKVYTPTATGFTPTGSTKPIDIDSDLPF